MDGYFGDFGRVPTNEERRRMNLCAQRFINAFKHVSECQNKNCKLPRCIIMKRILWHIKTCPLRPIAIRNCSFYRGMISVCQYHAVNCQEANCDAPMCRSIKRRIREILDLRSNMRSQAA